MLRKAYDAYEHSDRALAAEIMKDKETLREMQRKFNKNHIKRMKKNSCKPEMTGVFSGILQNLERIGNSCMNIAEEIEERFEEENAENERKVSISI